VVVKKPGAELTRARSCWRFYEGKVAKWQVPDDVVFVDAIPLGATGKMQKNKLREQFSDYRLPAAASAVRSETACAAGPFRYPARGTRRHHGGDER
jgi:acyl-coenzyme A synthetase/AMP-(fatty) acid ligase